MAKNALLLCGVDDGEQDVISTSSFIDMYIYINRTKHYRNIH